MIPALITLFAFVTAVLWLVIGWRAMRAHERIAEALAALALADGGGESPLEQRREDSAARKRLYKTFLAEDPARGNLPPKARHDAFRRWLEERGGDEH